MLVFEAYVVNRGNRSERERERERRKKPNFFPEENNPLTLHQLLVDQA